MDCVRTYVCTYVFAYMYVCVCVCVCVYILSRVSTLDTDQYGVLVTL